MALKGKPYALGEIPSYDVEDSRDFANRVSSDETSSLLRDLQSVDESKTTGYLGNNSNYFNTGSGSFSKEDKQNIARGALQGGKSGIGGLITGGATSALIAGAGPAGWAALGGGLLISQLEAQKEAEAMQEQKNIEAEIQRRQNAQKAGNSLLAYFNSIGNMKV